MIWLLALACTSGSPDTGDTDVPFQAPAPPHLVVTADQRDLLRQRIDTAPYDHVYAQIQGRAARDWRERDDPGVFDATQAGTNGATAQANAFLAWLNDDAVAAAKAIDFLERFEDDYETYEDWDINIRMAGPLITYSAAIDLLLATNYLDEGAADPLIDKLVSVNDQFFEDWVEDDVKRAAVLGLAQNNHPMRTAAAVGYVALAFPRSPKAAEQLDWAVSELAYLWGPDGQYVQADGGISEGPFYYSFGLAASLAFLIALDNTADPNRVYLRDCRNRVDVDPWDASVCVDGEPFHFDNPLYREDFAATMEWWMSLRLPSGLCPPLADAYFNPLAGAAMMSHYQGDGRLVWNWQNAGPRSYELFHGQDLSIHHLAYVDTSVAIGPPAFTTRVMPDAGQAVLRSGWDTDARWLMLVGEHGSARKTLHDHADGTSFSLAAYGEYLLVDTGYYKVTELSLPRTAQPQAHNVVLVDGQGAPPKGLLHDWGDADAFLANGYDGARLDYAEVTQTYQEVDFLRSVAMVRDRWFFVADRLDAAVQDTREFRWRLGGYAGLGAGGTFTVAADGATWQRDAAGVDVHLASTAAGLSVVEPPYVEGFAPHVHLFDLQRTLSDHGVIDGVVQAQQPGFLAVLAPYKVDGTASEGKLAVVAEPLGAGVAAWRVTSDGAEDLVVLRDPTAATSLTLADGTVVATDATLAVVSLTGPSLAMIAGGTTLSVDGTVRATSTSAAPAFVEP